MEEGLAAALRIVGLVLHRILGMEDREHLPVLDAVFGTEGRGHDLEALRRWPRRQMR
jgi:hypothetical protein